MVKRYGIEGELIYQKDDGHIVRYEDYEILQHKLGGVSHLCEEAMRINCEWEKAMMASIGEDGIGSVTKAIEQLKADKQELQQKLDAMAAENAALKSNLIFWDAEDPESPYDFPEDIANDCCMDFNTEFDVWVAAKMPNRTYRVYEAGEYDCKIELVSGGMPKTPATDAYLNSVRAEGVEILTSKLQTLIDEGVFDDKEIGVAAGAVYEGARIAANLRSGTHDTADKAGAQ